MPLLVFFLSMQDSIWVSNMFKVWMKFSQFFTTVSGSSETKRSFQQNTSNPMSFSASVIWWVSLKTDSWETLTKKITVLMENAELLSKSLRLSITLATRNLKRKMLRHSSMHWDGSCSSCVNSSMWRTVYDSGIHYSLILPDMTSFITYVWRSSCKSARRSWTVTSPNAWKTYRRRPSACAMFRNFSMTQWKSS